MRPQGPVSHVRHLTAGSLVASTRLGPLVGRDGHSARRGASSRTASCSTSRCMGMLSRPGCEPSTAPTASSSGASGVPESLKRHEDTMVDQVPPQLSDGTNRQLPQHPAPTRSPRSGLGGQDSGQNSSGWWAAKATDDQFQARVPGTPTRPAAALSSVRATSAVRGQSRQQ